VKDNFSPGNPDCAYYLPVDGYAALIIPVNRESEGQRRIGG